MAASPLTFDYILYCYQVVIFYMPTNWFPHESRFTKLQIDARFASKCNSKLVPSCRNEPCVGASVGDIIQGNWTRVEVGFVMVSMHCCEVFQNKYYRSCKLRVFVKSPRVTDSCFPCELETHVVRKIAFLSCLFY